MKRILVIGCLLFFQSSLYAETVYIDCEGSWNKKNKVGSHYLVSKKGDIFQLIKPEKRAWHAGQSFWKGFKDINSKSIGIELDNFSSNSHSEPFTKLQIDSLCKLIKKISKYYKILPENVLGNSDIAPFRKKDPGEKFPWDILQNKKLSYLPKKNKKFVFLNFTKKDKNKEKALKMLRKIGYDTRNVYSKRGRFSKLIKAYQRHFRQTLVDGKLDSETFSIIFNHYKDLLTL